MHRIAYLVRAGVLLVGGWFTCNAFISVQHLGQYKCKKRTMLCTVSAGSIVTAYSWKLLNIIFTC